MKRVLITVLLVLIFGGAAREIRSVIGKERWASPAEGCPEQREATPQ
jgi:hypothetical protein